MKTSRTLRHIVSLALEFRRSNPPTRMPAYSHTWRCWWATALALLRRAGIRDRAARDAIHERLLHHYQLAALNSEENRL